ncbi:beta-ketoacyl-[acyl-carrier-protein] synthase family protein [Streptomyces sp. APSN-46.1]|uniref:beta-ketoacyl-[acyl-carrier-protein] synthase family protein n=1 Tax=Streptomyces sp. APSN-46.1 TaxID=2929049 RepID=UPI001FB34A58|nr:beta-ketoacyl-[acyl-carrier-protein] synthase family protein [Streptomyces sp. APSN-46.1]MCJ1678501.1 beta-ketoacyl-[acyl-carrier-protein] synthase family protein [Streptomyces sp. APSN-46.1]
MARRIVITGMGPVSNIGTGIEEFSAALRLGKSGVGPIRSFDSTGFLRTVAGEVEDFRPESIVQRVVPEQWGRSSLFAAAAARLAATDAGIDLSGDRTAVIMGTTSGEIVPIVDMAERWHHEGIGLPDPDLASRVPASRLALAAAQELGARGEVMTLGTACSAGNYALGYAYDLINAGEADAAVAGGADSVARFTHAGFHRLGALAEDCSHPFDRDRDGIITAEGGVALVLETLESARARGARVYAEILGHGMSCDAKHPVAPDADSIARCIRTAHERAGVTPDQIDYICAHGTGTKTNDLVESNAVRAVFGQNPPPMSSIKSMLGHAMGAASGFGAVACALSIHEGFLPPTTNHRNPDPELEGIDPVPNVSREAEVRVAQNNGFAFGGNNAIVLLGRVDVT